MDLCSSQEVTILPAVPSLPPSLQSWAGILHQGEPGSSRKEEGVLLAASSATSVREKSLITDLKAAATLDKEARA